MAAVHPALFQGAVVQLILFENGTILDSIQ
jgi:hypothetical protein